MNKAISLVTRFFGCNKHSSLPQARAPLAGLLLAFVGALGFASHASATVSATYVGTDTSTEGTWTSVYGADGQLIPTVVNNTPSYATVTPSGGTAGSWATSTTDLRDLQNSSGSSNRTAPFWYNSATESFAINITDGKSHLVSLYLLDWDSQGRGETVTVTNTSTSAVLSSQNFTSFTNGKWAKWQVSGAVTFTVTLTAGANAVVSGIFFDSPGVFTPNTTSVTCQSGGVSQLTLCPAVLYTAVGGSVTIGATLGTLSGTGTAYTSISDNCTVNQVLASGSSCVVYSNFDASVAGTYAAVWTPNVSAGSVSSGVTYNATVVSSGYLTSNASGGYLLCPASAVGTAATCSSGVTFTAVGGPVTLASVPFAPGWGPFDFFLTAGGGWYTTNETVALGTCTGGLTLIAGASCTTGAITQTPIGTGINYAGIDVRTTAGAGASIYLNTSGATGTTPSIVAVMPNPVTCPITSVGTPVTCGTIEITAGASIAFGASPYTFTDPEFTIATTGDTCLSTSQAASAICTTGVITFTPTSLGVKNTTLTVTPTSGTANTTTITGTAVTYGVLTPSQTAVACAPLGVSTAQNCTTVLYTAIGGPIAFSSSSAFTETGTGAATFQIVPTYNVCQAGQVLSANQSCWLYIYAYAGATAGSASATLTPNLTGGSYSSAVTYTTTVTSAYLTASTGTGGTISCTSAAVGATSTCSTPVTLTATGGSVTLASTPFISAYGNATYYNASTTAYIEGNMTYANGTCYAGLTLASGTTCTTGTATMVPVGVGTNTVAIAVNTTSGGGTYWYLGATGTGTAPGLASISPQTLTCPATAIGTSVSCGTLEVFADAGSTLGASPYTFSDPEFTISTTNDTCVGATLAANGVCQTGGVTFKPTSSGTKTATFTVSPSTGSAITSTLSGTGTAGSLTATTATIACGNEAVNSTATCATETLTATGGPVTLAATPFTSSDPEFSVPLGTCTGNLALAAGGTCTTGALTFTPSSGGVKSATLTAAVATAEGTGTTFAATGTGITPQCSFTLTSTSSCSGNYGTSEACSALTLTASGASCASTISSITDINSTNFTLATSGTGCSSASNGSTCTITPTYLGNSTAAATDTVTVTTSNGSPTSTVTGTPLFGTASVSTVPCGSVGIGLTGACSGTVTVSPSGAPIILASTPYVVSGNLSEYTYTAAGTGACTPGQALISGSCKLINITQFSPTASNSQPLTVTVTPVTNEGFAGSGGASGTGAYGTAVISAVACGNGTIGESNTCAGTVTITASGGALLLSSPTYTVTGSSTEFTYAAPSSGACTANQTLAVNASCNLLTVSAFNPTASGVQTMTVHSSLGGGTAGSNTVTGTGTAAGAASVSAITCGSATVGVATACTGTIAVTASGGSIQLGSTPYALSGSSSQFTYAAPSSGACTANQVLASGVSCNLVTVSAFTPTATGAVSMTATVTPAVGSVGSNTASGTGVAAGTATVSTLACGSAGVGTTAGCAGTLTVTATGGAIVLGSTPYVLSGSTSQFTYAAPGSGACTANQNLASAASCNLITVSQFAPTSAGALSMTATVTPSIGTASANTVTGTGTYGTLASSGTVTCAATNAGSSSTCTGAITLTASGGPVVLTATPFSNSDSTDFTVGLGSCTANSTIASGSSCTTGTITFNPTTSGAKTDIVTVNATSGTGTTFNLSGTSNAYLTVSPTSLACSATQGINTTGTCGTVTLTANGGSITLGAIPFASSDAEFTQALGTCTANATLIAGGTCTTGQLSFDPTSSGAKNTTVTVASSAASISYTASGTGVYGALSASANLTCGSSTVGSAAACGTVTLSASGGPVTLTSSPLASSDATDFTATLGTCTAGGTIASGGSCTVSVSMTPSVTGALSDTVTVNTTTGTGTTFSASGTGYTYTWTSSSYGSCTGGAGTWNYSSWAPTTGCGTGLTQTRTGSCVANANSGTETRTVTCVRNDSTTVAGTFCSGTAPASSAACTPTTGFSCGTEGALSQTFNDTSTCSYTWTAGSWSASSNTCDATATQTRSVSCTQSDGTTVADDLCSDAGAKPATSQTVADYSTCTFSWTQGGYTACTGGTGTWNYTSWTPASGCGTTSQSRTGTCVADATSAAQSQTVTCLRSDGTTVDNSQCSGAGVEPATSQSCTPTSGFSCGTEGALTQSTTLTDTCTYIWTAGSWSASSNTCSSDATQTRTVSCTRSDGTTVDSSLCAETGAAPASSQTVADYSSCTYNWTQSGFGICSGGTGTWNYSSWAPTTGCGTNLTQTRSGTCVANTNSVTQTQTVLCQRSDGSTVDNSFCTTTEPATSQTCTPTVDFSCGPEGALSQSFSDTSLCGYTWASSAWSASANTCADATTQTRTVSCLQSDGTTVANSFCVDAGAQPAATQTVSDFSTCTYSYVDGAYGACTGGTGTWVYGSWAPTSGCGTNLTQTRSGTCVADAGSSSQSRTVSCTRSNGDVVDASFCAGQTADPTSASCTPTSGYSCGTEGSLSQSFSDTSTCSYGWTSSAWSAPSSSCSATATETRTNSCERSDGTIVDDSLCTGAAPATTQSVAIYSGCTFNWVGEGFGACSGGTGTWNYSSWTPATGCGTTAQTRTGTCVADANSSVQTQTVICQRSDGTTVAGTNCTGTAPATSQACTPSDSFSCGTEASLTQSVSLTNSCSYSWQTSAWSAPSSSCSTAATETRSVTCEQSDGTTVADGLCSGAGAKPATSQTLSVLTGCTFNWNASGFGACTGGSASWQYTSWTPSAGCGTFTQTRTGSCVQTANSGSATQTVTCERSDGTPVDASNCTGSAPATSEACTPTSASCGTEGALSQSATDTSLCGYTWATTAWSAPSSSCSDTATESRTVTCQQSDGETVANSFCVDAGAQPSASQYVPTYSGCGTLAFSTSSVSCPATGAGTSASCTSVTLTANGGPVQLGATALSSTDSTDFTIAGGCTSDLQLAAGASCSIAVITNPAAVGATSATVTANVNGQLGTGGATFALSGSGTYGYAVATPSTQVCQSQGLGTGLEHCENFATITATNGPIVLASASPFTNSDPEFSVYGGTCSAGSSLAVNQSCTYEGAFNGTSIGEKSDTVTVATSQGTGTSFVLTAAVGYGIVTINPTSLACGSETVGQTTSCGAGSVTVTATAGEVIFDANPFSLNDNTDFTVAAGTCANATLAIGQSCTSGAIAFSPVSAGAKASTVTVTPNFGTSGTFSLSGTGVYGYSWQAGGFGSCTGGSGTWGYSSWTPTTGCGVILQSRTGTCSVTAGSGTQTQTVSCVRSDGTAVNASNCTGAAPASSQSCTPATASCGAEGALTQSVTLTNACSYNWVVGTAGACTGGSAAWSYTAWTPAAGSHCTTQLAQTRSGTCTPVANSGTATASVSCQDQTGNVVANSNCTGTAPSGTSACTPSSGYSCGTEGSLAQTVSDLSSCAYSWTSGTWGTCSGGTGTWTYSSWTPTCGIGPTTQTRTGTCVAATNGGSQSRVVACSRSDGTVMANSYCTGSAPAATETCTSTTGFSCGTEGLLSQKVTLTNKCQ